MNKGRERENANGSEERMKVMDREVKKERE